MKPARLAVWVLFFVFCTAAWPQSSTSAVRGAVRDQTGAVIPGASVTLTNTATNVSLRTATNHAGLYLFPGVSPGAYRLSVESAGMARFEGALTVQVRQDAVVDAVLSLGQTATQVSVVDVTPIVRTDSPTLGYVLERQRIEQLPINGRSVLTLMQTVVGVEQDAQFDSPGARAYGMRFGSQEFVQDGAALTERLWGGLQKRPPGLDTVQEFRVEANNSSARYTRPFTVVMSTKSGTNMLHGSVFETHRNNAIGKARARTDFYSSPPQLIRNEFGASAGGPFVLPKVYNGRNRTFWFFGYEGQRNINPTTQGFPVPTQAMRNGDFRGLVDSQGRQYKIYNPWTTDPNIWTRQQFAYSGQPNVIDPSLLSPLTKYLYSITPLPTLPNVNPLVDNNWWGPVPSNMRQYTVTGRADHRFSDKDQMYARYTQGNYYLYGWWRTQPMLNGVPGTNTNTAPTKSLAVSWDRTFSPTLFNELLVSGSREFWYKATGDGKTRWADILGLPNPLGVAGWPRMLGTGISNYYFHSDNAQGSAFTYLVLDDNATRVVGRHELQFGAHYRKNLLNYLPDQQWNQGNHNFSTLATALYDPNTARTNPLATAMTGHDLANMYLGVMNYTNQFVRGFFYLRSTEWALYLQDNFRVTRRLTLNLGLRWEAWPALREKHGVMTSFDRQKHAVVLGTELDPMYQLSVTMPSIVSRLQTLGAKFITYRDAGLPSTLVNSNWADFGPRLGFAYRTGNGARSLVVRGGFRTSYFPIPIFSWGQRMRMNAPLTASFQTNLGSAEQAPDGTANYGMRSVPTIIAGKNSGDAVKLNNPLGITRGSSNATYFNPDQPDPLVHDWNLTLEKQVMAETVARVAYVGNHGARLEQLWQFNNNPTDYIWFVTTGQRAPTGDFASVARRPYDQQVYGTMEEVRHSGWSNFNGTQFELERRYSRGYAYQFTYLVGNTLGAGGQGYSGTSLVPGTNEFMPGAMPADDNSRNRLLSYQRDTTFPKHRVRWNWIVDVPVGKGKWLAGNSRGLLDKLIGGWQMAGMGSLRSNYFALPAGIYPNGNKIQLYGYKYPIQDCRSGACYPGYLWWNGYIPANQINSVGANGKPNGVMGVPADYKPAAEPLIPWPAKPDTSNPLYAYYGTNTVWVTLKDGTQQRTTYNDNLNPWRQQYLPGVRAWTLDASLFKSIPIKEKFALRFNADFFNVLNHPGNPNTIGSEGILDVRSSGTGAREIQLTLRLSW